MENAKIHQIKVDFNVTPEIQRYVYVYIIEAKHCYLVDSGVCGCEEQILNYLASIGRSVADIKGILVTHSHPDHIGTLSWFQWRLEKAEEHILLALCLDKCMKMMPEKGAASAAPNQNHEYVSVGRFPKRAIR